MKADTHHRQIAAISSPAKSVSITLKEIIYLGTITLQ